jgi:hypothetical protein
VQLAAPESSGTGSALWFLASTAILAYVLVPAVLALALRRRLVALTLAPLAVFAVPASAGALCNGPVPTEPNVASRPAERAAEAATGVGRAPRPAPVRSSCTTVPEAAGRRRCCSLAPPPPA